MYVYLCVHVYAYTCVSVYVRICVHVYVYVCGLCIMCPMPMCVCVCVCARAACVYVRVYVCACVHVGCARVACVLRHRPAPAQRTGRNSPRSDRTCRLHMHLARSRTDCYGVLWPGVLCVFAVCMVRFLIVAFSVCGGGFVLLGVALFGCSLRCRARVCVCMCMCVCVCACVCVCGVCLDQCSPQWSLPPCTSRLLRRRPCHLSCHTLHTG